MHQLPHSRGKSVHPPRNNTWYVSVKDVVRTGGNVDVNSEKSDVTTPHFESIRSTDFPNV